MSFVNHYLLFQAAAYHPPALALLPFQSLFTESSRGDQILALPPFSSVLTAPCPLCCMFLFSSLFIIQFFFAEVGVILAKGLCWNIPGVAVGIPCDAYLITCWSAGCLPSRFGASVWQHGSPPVFSV
jgi:hypothetical protein